MASQDHLLNRIATLVGGFDDASWEALGSKGLLRRARKDMEKGVSAEVGEQVGETLQIKVQAFTVSMPASGPAKATCSCPAPGICQHILIAGLFLQSKTPSPSRKRASCTPETIRDEIIFFTPERLKSWAGASDYRAGISVLEKNALAPVIEYGESILIRLMPSSIEARYVPRGGLDGMVLPRAQGKRVAVAALLALRKSLGLELPEAAEQTSLIEISGTPRTPKEILESAAAVLEDAVKIGLSHASPIFADRLVTLAVSAQGANLPRVSLALKTVADEVDSILKREARADESRLLLVMSRVYALMEAIRYGGEAPKFELAGVSRSAYVDVPEIELFGIGAYTWKTGSGYEGLTVLFWSNQSKEFLSWSAARPGTQKFDPRQRFYAEGPWDGAQSPQQVATSQFKLRNARRTVNGRLSGSTKTSALVLGATPLQTLNFANRLFHSWSELDRYVREKQPLGLRDPNPLELIVVLEPTSFGTRKYDAISQTFAWELYDQADQLVTMTLPFRDWSKDAIRVLETLEPGENSHWRIVARAAVRNVSMSIEPVSILKPDSPQQPVFQLTFDTMAAGVPRRSETIGEDGDDEAIDEEAVEETAWSGHTYLNRLSSELNGQLLSIAEMGCQNAERSNREWFEKRRSDLYSSGLTVLANVASGLADSAEIAASDVLRASYLVHLHMQAAGQFLESN
ncbi:MAG TPA: hypothetical protein VJN92_10435 [Candidatus Acidoferrum sp.]|nr:hypothetical protein [Candidatus Acidoferrum sp.]